MTTEQHFIPNHDGWNLSLVRTVDPHALDRTRRPVLIVPGYGMNSFIFGYHPRGLSLVGYLASRGFEVWQVDLRAQGASVSTGGGERFGLEDLAGTDLTAALEAVRQRTEGRNDRVDVIGASLGGTIVFLHAALRPDHVLGSIVAIGSPVRWVKIHPLLAAAFGWPWLVGQIRITGTRALARVALPAIARHAPALLGIYMNPTLTDVSAAAEMVKTVENPNRFVNKQIAHWMAARDLIVGSVNLSERLRDLDRPLLCVIASHDGIVPRETAEFAMHQVRSREKSVLVVGHDEMRMAHADLFVSAPAQGVVFDPIAQWLQEATP